MSYMGSAPHSKSFLSAAILYALAGCSSGSQSTVRDAAVDGATDGSTGAASGLRLTGSVQDKAGAPVASAKIEVAGASVFSDTEGKYELTPSQVGALAVKVTRNWFRPLETTVNVAPVGVTRHDLTIEEVPLKLDPADAATAERHARTFDWTKNTISITIAAKPTRRDFDNAVYFRNPALYRDTSKEPMLVPSPLPELAGGTAKNLTFKLTAGRNSGQEALDLTTVVDRLEDTALPAGARAEFMVWTPMLNWLGEKDPAQAADLRAAGVAVRQQTWGGTASRPQDIDRVYLDAATGALWAEVVFATFVQVGPGITDNDGDGRKEVFARIAGVHHGKEVTDRLAGEYRTTVFTTHGLSREVTKSLNELYSTATAAQVERYIGEPLELPGIGTINHPFVVLRHSGGQKNVILVAP